MVETAKNNLASLDRIVKMAKVSLFWLVLEDNRQHGDTTLVVAGR